MNDSEDIYPNGLPFMGNLSEARILITMPLLFRSERLIYFFEQIRCFAEYGADLIDIRIITNTSEMTDQRSIMNLLYPFQSQHFLISIQSFWNHDDPKEMTWVHKKIIESEFIRSTKYTHFLYLEDDLRISRMNMEYFIKNRIALRPFGFIPSFIRYEFNFSTLKLYTSDIVNRSEIAENALLVDGRKFVTPDNPYCAAYILDHELANEYVLSDSFDPDKSAIACGWPSTERSAMGLCFENVPPGHVSRFKIPIDNEKNIPDVACLIHHLPNNFANRDWPEGHTPFGKLELLKMFSHGRED